jgi:SAM-dependent methyltransferase
VEREDWNRRHGESGQLFGVDPNRFLVAEVDGLAPGRALDLACGAGRNAVWLAEQGWQVTGADFSDVAIDNARRLAGDRGVAVEWLVADLREWEPPVDDAFDLIVVLYLHLPAEERRPIMRRAAAALAGGGTILVVGHHSANIAEGTGGPQDPRVLFTAEDIAADLEGLDVEKAERVLRPVEGERDAVDALVRARRP